MIDMIEARARVARGAAHLDRVRPGWQDRIDVGTLTLHDQCGCIVGQLTGAGAWVDDWRVFGLDDYDLVACGFDISDEDDAAAGPDLSSAQVFAPLQDAWIEAIAARRHPVAAETREAVPA